MAKRLGFFVFVYAANHGAAAPFVTRAMTAHETATADGFAALAGSIAGADPPDAWEAIAGADLLDPWEDIAGADPAADSDLAAESELGV